MLIVGEHLPILQLLAKSPLPNQAYFQPYCHRRRHVSSLKHAKQHTACSSRSTKWGSTELPSLSHEEVGYALRAVYTGEAQASNKTIPSLPLVRLAVRWVYSLCKAGTSALNPPSLPRQLQADHLVCVQAPQPGAIFMMRLNTRQRSNSRPAPVQNIT